MRVNVIQWLKLLTVLVILPLLLITNVRAQSVTQGTTVSVGVGDTVLVVTGSTSPNAFVTFKEGGSTIGTTSALANGSFSQTFPAQSPGIHNISIYARDSQNRLTDTVTVSVNLLEHFTTTLDVFLSPTIQLMSSQLTRGESLVIRGETIPNGTITITLDNGQTFQTTSNSSGQWDYSLNTSNLSTGTHRIFAQASDGGGQQSHTTAERTFNVTDPLPPDQQTQAPAAPVITEPADGTEVDANSVVIRGTAQPGTQIVLLNFGSPIGSVFTDRNGNWQIELSLRDRLYQLTARACIRTACSGLSNTIRIYHRVRNPEVLLIRLEKYMGMVEVGQPIAIRGTIEFGQEPFELTIKWGDGKTDTLKTSEKRFGFTHTYKHAGMYNGSVEAKDNNGATYKVAFSVLVTTAADHVESQGWWIILLAILLALLFLARKRRKNTDDQQDSLS